MQGILIIALKSEQVSHLKGALRCGATKQEVDTVVEQTALVFGLEALKQAQEVRDDTWRKEAEKKDKKKPKA